MKVDLVVEGQKVGSDHVDLTEQVDREGTPTDAFAHAPDHVISEAAWDDFGATYEPEPGR